MKDIKSTKLHITYKGKPYAISVSSVLYAETIIVNKLIIGYASFWLVLQGNNWRITGEMPLCHQLKQIIVRKVAAFHKLPALEKTMSGENQAPFRSGFLLNTFLNIIAKQGHLP